jgi:hypothetical protein
MLSRMILICNTGGKSLWLVLAGMEFKEGPGFILLAGKGPAGELLLDPACVIAAAT